MNGGIALSSLAETLRRVPGRLAGRLRRRVCSRTRLGLALSPDGAVAVEASPGLRRLRPVRTLTRELAAGPGPDGWPELARALDALRDDIGRPTGEAELHVALLPPISRTKCLRLPAADREKLRTLLAREAGRHFLGAPETPVADVTDAAARPWNREEEDRVAVCADREAVEAALQAIRDAGFRPGLVVAGAPALVAAATALEPDLRGGDVRLTVEVPPWEEELALEGGRLAAVRPLPRNDDGTRAAGAEGARRLGEPGATPGGLGPRALAAFGALLVPEDGPSLLFGEDRSRWRGRLRRRALTLAAAAAALLAVSAGLHLWGVERELEAVAEERRAIADRVRRTADARDALLEIRRLVASVRRAAARGPRWTEVLASVAGALPPSAYLESVRAEEGKIRLSGVARSPSSLVPRLQGLPLLEEVSAPSAGRARGDARSFEVGVTLAGLGPEAGVAGVEAASTDGAREAAAPSAEPAPPRTVSRSRPAGEGTPP